MTIFRPRKNTNMNVKRDFYVGVALRSSYIDKENRKSNLPPSPTGQVAEKRTSGINEATLPVMAVIKQRIKHIHQQFKEKDMAVLDRNIFSLKDSIQKYLTIWVFSVMV